MVVGLVIKLFLQVKYDENKTKTNKQKINISHDLSDLREEKGRNKRESRQKKK